MTATTRPFLPFWRVLIAIFIINLIIEGLRKLGLDFGGKKK